MLPNILKRIRRLLHNGRFRDTDHGLDRKGHRGIRSYDVEYIIDFGMIVENPQWDDYFNDWKYKVEGTTTDGEPAYVIIKFDNMTGDAVLITASYK